MKILAIETSADETGVSVLEIKETKKGSVFKVLANYVASQIALHTEYGGIYPMLAKREHIKNLPILFEKVIKKTKIKKTDIVAVTRGPGLEPALWTGIVFAKELAQKWHVPLVPVNHMEGHILSVFGKEKEKFMIPNVTFPLLSLLVSGGHTELVLVTGGMSIKGGSFSSQKYKVIGETLDDAAGEAFDKVARMLGLPYPGGPEISRLAEELRSREKQNKTSQGRNFSAEKFTQSSSRRPAESLPSLFSFSLPRPMMYSKNFDFSFSGLKTAVLYLIKKIGPLDSETKKKIALEFENAVVETLLYKTKKAIEKYNIKTLIVAGGVASNKHLRKEIQKAFNKKVTVLFPDKALSTDNSVMIGMAGYFQFLKKKSGFGNGSRIKAEGGLRL